ncbi:MAG: hypothetical protein ABJA64_01615, partial [Candidatus Saccharibacteria bacterium]
IVAYNGVTSRAKLSSYQTETAGLVKKAESYNSVTGAYALTAAGSDTMPATCPTAAAAALLAKYNAQNETKISSAISFCGVVASAPSFADATTAITANASVDYYYVQYCSTGKGMYIYYPDPTTASTVKSVTVGTCP